MDSTVYLRSFYALGVERSSCADKATPTVGQGSKFVVGDFSTGIWYRQYILPLFTPVRSAPLVSKGLGRNVGCRDKIVIFEEKSERI